MLQKHGRPTDLKTALRQSAGVDPVAETPSKKSKGPGKRPPRLIGDALPVFAARLRPFAEPRNDAPATILAVGVGVGRTGPIPALGAPIKAPVGAFPRWSIEGARDGRPV